MIEFVEDHYRWNPAGRMFLLIEKDIETLVDVEPIRTDVQAQRVADGWGLITTVDVSINAQQILIDLWSHAGLEIEQPDDSA